MNWIENVLIIAGVSLDIFAAMSARAHWSQKWTKNSCPSSAR